MEMISHYYQTLVELEHFPGWELYIFLNLLLWVSAIYRLNRIERKVTND